MTNYILLLVLSFLSGVVLTLLLVKRNNNSELFVLLNDFKNSIENFNTTSKINTTEVKNAIKDANALAKALTTNQNTKGRFGEDCLETIIKTCYPAENIHYIRQFISRNEDNKEIKPDFLIKLPNNKAILIDSKLNLDKFIEYKENKCEKQAFIRDLNNTINSLGNKKYQTALNTNQPDFILMYIPLEPVLSLIYTDSDFLSVVKNANENNIIIVGTSGILSAIRIVKLLWAKETQNKNVENIVSIAKDIYSLVAAHSQMLFRLKNTLEENTVGFMKEYEKITRSNTLFKQIEKLSEYGIELDNKKSAKKHDDIKIHSDFLN